MVEDNEINRFLLRRYLEGAGHKVTEAMDGQHGVEMAQAHGYDVILMDISMPRMDGIAATERIRNAGGPSAKARILALTAHAMPEEQQKFRTVGMETGLTKPISRVELLRRLAGDFDGEAGGASESGQDGILDAAPLAELIGQIGPEMAAMLIQRLVAEADTSVERIMTLQDAAHDGDVARMAHQLAGTCGTFGTVRLRVVLSGVDAAVKMGARDELERHRSQLPHVWGATRRALEDQLALMEGVT